MAITEQELHPAGPGAWQTVGGPLLTLAAIALIVMLGLSGFRIPNPPAILLLVVAFSAFYGGTRSGMVSAVIAWVFFAYYFSIPDRPFQYAGENFTRVVMWAVTTPAMAVMIGFLRRRSERIHELTSKNLALETQITQRKRAEEEVRLLQAMAVAVGETADLYSALEVVLRKVCESTGWLVGQAWMQGETGRLECVPAWHTSVSGLESFRKTSLDMTFAPGVGLPGQAWTSRRPVWARDVTHEGNFPRARAALQVGLRAGLAVPVMSGAEVIAVLEFFVREPRDEDEHLAGIVSSIAIQLGSMIRRKHTEQALHRSENQLRAIIDAEPECVKIVAGDGTLLQMNAAGLAMIEAGSAEQVIGKSVFGILTPEYREPFRTFMENVLSGNKGTFEFEIIGFKGTHRWLETHAVSMPNDRGGPPVMLWWASCSSTSTVSNTSMTASGTRRATTCFARLPSGWEEPFAAATPWRA
ncbi:MAG: GAF domain-containing protein [Gammaproteobacteria bacterium]|nr:GAF domain-containing protein [Gammaproteobacteria bacterium]